MDILIEKIADFIVLILLKIVRLIGGKTLFCSPSTIEAGVLGAGEIEQYHPLYYIKEHILQDESNTLIIGSPHLKYWFETADEPRMLSFLRNTMSFKVSICYYQGNQFECNESICRGMRICKEKYPDRFSYYISHKSPSISYIAYKFKDGKHLRYRCLVGFQETSYRTRPFIEFVS